MSNQCDCLNSNGRRCEQPAAINRGGANLCRRHVLRSDIKRSVELYALPGCPARWLIRQMGGEYWIREDPAVERSSADPLLGVS